MIVVPDERIPTFVKLLQLSDSSLNRLIETLGSAPLTPSADEMAEFVADSVPEIDREDLGDIIDMLYGMYWVRAFADAPLPKFLNDVMADTERVLETATSEALAHHRGRFEQLLNIGTLTSCIKRSGCNVMVSDYTAKRGFYRTFVPYSETN